jgi:hypothetical protein
MSSFTATAAPAAAPVAFNPTTTTENHSKSESKSESKSDVKPLWRVGARYGIVAAVATTVIAAVALAADVPLAVDGEQIPVAGFAQMTLLGAALGVLLAKGLRRWSAHAQRRFVQTTVAMTALSLVPDLAMDFTTASKAVLVATHLTAAAIIIPALSRRLADQES